MRLVQFHIPGGDRRLGIVSGEEVLDLTSLDAECNSVYTLFRRARQREQTLEAEAEAILRSGSPQRLSYEALLKATPKGREPWLLAPIDHPDPAHCYVGGTGLTHLGSMAQRDQMHKASDAPKTDSQRMFEMGLKGGKSEPGKRGIAPECFYKGSGVIVRGPNDLLDIPPFAMDCGEEPEIVGCYIIGPDGVPYRLGFAIGNEWADHAMERVNYLWLAPSKLRACGVGPELVTDEPFQDLRGYCRIYRGEEVLYDSGELLTGEQHMSHSLANLEDHHFKHEQFRIPGDVHIYFFGTMKLSYGHRGPLQDGDRIEITFPRMGAPLVNYVRRLPPDDRPIQVRKG